MALVAGPNVGGLAVPSVGGLAVSNVERGGLTVGSGVVVVLVIGSVLSTGKWNTLA